MGSSTQVGDTAASAPLWAVSNTNACVAIIDLHPVTGRQQQRNGSKPHPAATMIKEPRPRPEVYMY